MGREQSFLDRMATLGLGGRTAPTTTEDVEALMDSVRRNLTRLLNSRHGLSEALPDYGLPALIDLALGGKNQVPIVVEAIRAAVEKYEPRLRSVRVTLVEGGSGSGSRPVFRIEAMLSGRGRHAAGVPAPRDRYADAGGPIETGGGYRIWYDASLDGKGGFEVAG